MPSVRTMLGIGDGTGSRAVALTFDDGPHPEATPRVLDHLAAAGVAATFFLVGEQVERRPELARRIAAAGHGVELHGHRHRVALALTPAQVRDDLARGSAAIADATGARPRLYPPYGIFSAASLAAVRRHGLAPLLWARDGRDWRPGASAEAIAGRLTRQLRGGEVLLLHDADHYGPPGCWRATVAALPLVVAELARRRLTVAPA